MRQQEPKKLLLVMPFPPPYSGPETYTSTLMKLPLSHRFQPILFDTSARASNVDRGRFDGRTSLAVLKRFIELVGLLRREKPDLVFSFMPANRPGFIKYALFVLPCLRLEIPIVLSSQASHFDKFYGSESAIMKAFITQILRRVNGVAVLANRLKDAYVPFLPSHKIWTTYLGIDRQTYDDVSEHRQSSKKVLFMGHISQAKGAFDLLEAAPLVLSQHPDALFQFAGDILEQERNVTFVRGFQADRFPSVNHLNRALEYLGVITGDSKLRAFSHSDVFALPSYAEGFPWVVLEAMLAGKPVVTTPVGALPEVFEHEEHLLFVEPGDVRGIANAISRLLDDRGLRERLGRAARRTVQRRFNLRTFSERLEEVFLSVMEGS